MVKIFVGRIPESIGSEKLREIFTKYGKVTECEKIKDYGFVVCFFAPKPCSGMGSVISARLFDHVRHRGCLCFSTWTRSHARRLPSRRCTRPPSKEEP